MDVEKAEVRERIRSSDEIPFGAKAMLEDPDIEGVWNSRASTPLQSPILAPRSSSHSRLSLNRFSKSRRNSSVSSLSQLDQPQKSPSNASAEAVSPFQKEPIGASSSAMPMPNRNSQDTPWQYHVPVPYAQNQAMPRRRSVTIRATLKGVGSAEETIQGEQEQVPCRIDTANMPQREPTCCRPDRSRSGDLGYRQIQYLQRRPMSDVGGPYSLVVLRQVLQRLKEHQLPERH